MKREKDLSTLTEDQVIEESWAAARLYTGMSLHARTPVEQHGDTRPQAWASRARLAEEAAVRWLACQARLVDLRAEQVDQ